VEVPSQGEKGVSTGCDGTPLEGLEFRNVNGALALARPSGVYAVHKLSSSPGRVRLWLGDATWSDTSQELEIRYPAGADEAVWQWTDIAHAEREERRALPLDSSGTLPRRVSCQ